MQAHELREAFRRGARHTPHTLEAVPATVSTAGLAWNRRVGRAGDGRSIRPAAHPHAAWCVRRGWVGGRGGDGRGGRR